MSQESSRQVETKGLADYASVLLDSSTDDFDENGNEYTVLGTMKPAIVIINGNNYESGPAAEYIQIDRGDREPNDLISITTLGGDE